MENNEKFITCWHEEGVEHADALRKHGDLQTLHLLEILHELGQSHLVPILVVKGESIPQGPLFAVVLLTGDLGWRCECQEGQSQVGEPVLEQVDIFVALDQLVELEADKTGNERRCRRDGRNNPSGNQLGPVAVSRCNTVVFRARV